MFTATVAPTSGPGTPSGTVTFKDGSNTLGASTLASGAATYSTSNLAAGPHSITAVYEGDVTFGGSTSLVLAQTVNKAGTTTAVVSSLNPSTYGQSVIFTATVTPPSGATTPTGSVTFKDGGTTLGSSPLNASGVATYSTSALPLAGMITAVYNGDTFYTGSTSPGLNQNVTQAGTSTLLASNLNPSTYGQSVMFTATVAPSSGTGTPPAL
jgi:hypothetical protein